ncbi:MAG: T9SS type A sorting domain-containing protein [Bacteroidota bacterium]
MKKLFTTSFLTAILFIAFNANAQLITISETHQLPVIGDSIHYVDANSFGFDAVGVGPVTAKVWDLSALMNAGTTFDFVYVDPTTIPVNLGRDSFPAATIARGQSDAPGYFYYQNTANDINRLGWFSSITNYGVYKNGTIATEFHFPITSGQNFNSTYNGNFAPFNVGEDSVRITDGTLTISADMQGQMILPTGTFNGVLRMHVIESFHIKTYMMGTVVQDNVISDDYYYWFTDTILQPLFIFGITTVDGTAQPTVLRYQPILSSASITSFNIENLNIYPNPASDAVHVIIPSSHMSVNYELYDVLGKMIKTNMLNQYDNIIDLTSFPKGTYTIKVYSDSGLITRKLLIE